MSFEFISSETISLAQENCISQSLNIQGNVHSKENIFISNTMHGNISSKQSIFIAKNAVIFGTVKAANVVIWGTVKGNIQADNIAALGDSAHIEGQITAHKFILSPQATLAQRPKLL